MKSWSLSREWFITAMMIIPAFLMSHVVKHQGASNWSGGNFLSTYSTLGGNLVVSSCILFIVVLGLTRFPRRGAISHN